MRKLSRQHRLLAMLTDTDELLVSEAAVLLGVSDDTIRRDLCELEKQGSLHKTHGGAVSINLGGMARTARSILFSEQKKRIGAAAAAAVPAGATLFLDAGSTTLALAEALTVSATVITNSLDIASQIEERSALRLILAGGEWDSRQRLFSGAAARSVLSLYRADIAILGACAVSARGAVTAGEERDADMKRTMINAASEAWLLADHLKFDHVEPHHVADLAQFCRIYSDRSQVGLDVKQSNAEFIIAS
ncbi:DeoR/GlpR family DNA-binding transcription regulator [Gluconobacter kanchanaburiensis]|uniref:DeoR family transcriptional regulator n=1 Tax=Gluconobacter kanchanaburiensis NBRC 103587 TaxID=1307948 RepID=A0A511B417_9PROT|nr:DeoR/GlpR family DNA-binding transcription regulator [Gluconobacter kanchanaburiensis]MBF0861533.1 DeoR/GlpR transcriptional regulator [Gluconobacter kanchanaburiensis]GBR66923.1 DeoR family transcriptional regulator [Gluconobacter kanchanaburiensis NBRC 103587]GEK95170.1 DeoR family transcriptional regulator [Gluconobacter kanchanaburiensis NBRC 103587]